MKFLVVAFICYAFIASVFTEEHSEEEENIKMECAKESGVAEDMLGKWTKGQVPEDAKLDEFFFCFMKKMGVMNEAGDYQVDEIKQKISEKFGDEVGKKMSEDCTKEKAATPQKAAHNLAKCYVEHVPKESQ